MTLAAGTRLGPYEIVALIGEGGMGEVFRAKDTRLDRIVAIKVLPAHLSDNPQLRERFEREARAVSSLSHPHICTLFDVGHQDGVDFLVMEHLEGENLADRLARGPLPPEQLLRYGAQIGEALAKAHRHGIVHRDLKPGNVILTKSGAKLLDFGLAKTAAAGIMMDAATELHKPLTAEGTILGTFQYMAPEQLEGLEADARTDIFALGAVLYEMATGRRAFEGKTRTSLIAAIVGGAPRRIEDLQPLTPRGFAHVVDKCLEKEPDDRWQSAHDVAAELKWIAQSSAGEPAATAVDDRRHRGRAALAAALALLAGIAGGLFADRYFGRVEPAAVVQATILPPPGVEVSHGETGDPIALSPDGRTLAFTGRDASGKKLLWVRPLGELVARPLTSTEEATYPFWSHDSQTLAFFSKGKLKKIALDGSPPVTICEVASNPLRGSWNSDGTILFSPASGAPIHQVAAAGGTSVAVTQLDTAVGESTHRWAKMLPDGESFLYLAGSHELPESSEVNAIYAGRLGSADRKLILRARSSFEYVAGHLLFTRNHTLLAQRFDPGRMQIEGEPFAVAKDVHYSADAFISSFAVSADHLVYATVDAGKQRQLVWLDRQGQQTGTLTEARPSSAFAVSPDGTTVALTIEDPSVGSDIWLQDLARGALRRFTLDGANADPVWSPDGKRLAYVGAKNHIYVRAVNAESTPELLWAQGTWGGPGSWSPDGRFLTLWRFDPKTASGYDALILPLFGDRQPIPLATTTAVELPGSFSPDGRWLLYDSDESGRFEIYAVSVPDFRRRRQVSVSGKGSGEPIWGGVREIWYQQPEGTWVTVTLVERADSAPDVSEARALFRDEQIVSLDILAGDDRLIGMREIGGTEQPRIVLVSGWQRLSESARR